jgi:hypothetical protein
MEDWSRRVRALINRSVSDEDRARLFMDDVMQEITRASGRTEALAYESAGRFDFSWSGLARYWRKRIEIDSVTNQ